VILAETAIGIGLTYGGFPAFLQPFHLLFGALLASMQFYLLMGSFMFNQALKNPTSPKFSNAAPTI
jgi:cytochrome c oxidase assembly protein subunit 15